MKFDDLTPYLNCNIYPKIYLRDRNGNYEFLGLGNSENSSNVFVRIVPFNDRQDSSWNYEIDQTIYPSSYIFKDLKKNTEDIHGNIPTDCHYDSTFKITENKILPNQCVYHELFDDAMKKISSSFIEKVVIARKRNFNIKGKINIAKAINYLINNTEQCYVYCISLSPSQIYIGATPECLYQRNHSTIYSESIAGTTSKNLIHELSSNKNLWENKIVVKHIIERLDTLLAEDVRISDPCIISPSEISHLKCSITGTLKENISTNMIVNALHPTPAMCGYPQDKAKIFLDKEPFARGLYSGIMNFKFFDLEQAPVLIRGLFINNNNLDLYVGSGIVKGSVEEQEWQELNNKEKLLLSLINWLKE